MTKKELANLAAKFGGWVEETDDELIARFPSVFQKDQFNKYLKDSKPT